MLFVFLIRAITNSLMRVKLPIFADQVSVWFKEHERRGRDGLDSRVGSQMARGKVGEPPGNVLLVERETAVCQKHQRIKKARPASLVRFEHIVKRAGAEGIFGQKQRS